MRSVGWMGIVFGCAGVLWGPIALGENLAQPSLTIQEMALTAAEHSWRTPASWSPGDPVWVRVVLSGLTRNAEGWIRVSQGLWLLGSEGDVLMAAPQLVQLEREVPEQPQSVELLSRFVLPEGLSKGSYHVRVSCRDKVTGASVERQLSFNVEENVEGGLRVEEFHLSKRPAPDGEILQGEATIIGYEISEERNYWIEADVALLDTTGKPVHRWQPAVSEQGRAIPVALPLRLTLELSLPPESTWKEGTVRLVVHDRIGSRTTAAEATW